MSKVFLVIAVLMVGCAGESACPVEPSEYVTNMGETVSYQGVMTIPEVATFKVKVPSCASHFNVTVASGTINVAQEVQTSLGDTTSLVTAAGTDDNWTELAAGVNALALVNDAHGEPGMSVSARVEFR